MLETHTGSFLDFYVKAIFFLCSPIILRNRVSLSFKRTPLIVSFLSMEKIKYSLNVLGNILVCELDAGFVKVTGLFISTSIIPLHFKITHAPKARSSQEETIMESSFSWKQLERSLVTYEESQVVFECSLSSATSVAIKLFCLHQPFLKLPATLPIQHFYCCQNNNLILQLRFSFIRSTDQCWSPSRKRSSNFNPRLPADPQGIWELTMSGSSCFKSSCQTSVYPPLFHPLPVISSLSSPQLRPVYAHLVASRVQTAEDKIDLTNWSFILVTLWNTFTTAEQTGFSPRKIDHLSNSFPISSFN